MPNRTGGRLVVHGHLKNKDEAVSLRRKKKRQVEIAQKKRDGGPGQEKRKLVNELRETQGEGKGSGGC